MNLTPFQAYRAMYRFLSEVYDMLDNDTLGALLNALTLEKSGLPKNKRLKDDWTQLCTSSGRQEFTAKESWYLMEEFLRAVALATDTFQMEKLVSYVSLHENDAEAQSSWNESVSWATGQETGWPE